MSESDQPSMSTDLHRECRLMLPWIVTGRIAASDRQRFERHLADCAECRNELAEQRELCELIRRDEPIMLAPQSSLQKLMARIDASTPDSREEPGAALGAPGTASLEAKSSRRPPWLAIAAALQAIVIAALLTIVWQQRESARSAPRYTTLSTTAPQPGGVLLRVVFTPQMTNAELQQLLRSVDASVVAGPTEAGVYSLRLAPGRSGPQVDNVLQKVRADPNVVFAEHVSGEVAR